MVQVAVSTATCQSSVRVLFIPSASKSVEMLLLRRLRRWRQDTIQPQIDRLRSVVVVPVITQGDERAGARRLPVSKERQRIAQFRIVHPRQRRAAIFERGFQRRHQLLF